MTSEDGHAVLEGPVLPLVAPFLDGENTSADIAARLDGRVKPLDVHLALLWLRREGHLAEGDDATAPEAAALRDALDLDADDFRERLAGTQVAVSSVGSADPEPLASVLRSLGVEVAAGAELSVVLADDYLAPALADFDRRALARRRSWMLVKPAGLVPWIGPVLRPGTTGCWACLARRLQETRPFREPSEARRARGSLQVPAPPLPSTLGLTWNAAAAQILRWVGSGRNPELEGRLIALDVRTLATERHRLVRLPHCPHCGAAPADLERPPAPIRLRRSAGRILRHGGYRTASPDDTYRRLAHHVSPVTGIVGRIRRLDGPAEAHLPVVRICQADYLLHAGSVEMSSRRPGRTRPGRTRPGRTRPGRVRHSTGRGFSSAQARTGALCEALERYSGAFQGGEKRFTARLVDLGDAGIHPHACLGYSSTQYREREKGSAGAWAHLRVPVPFDEERPVEWSPLWSLTEDRFKFLPTAYCYFGYSLPEDHRFCRADSNGNAAGATLEEAVLQGFFEVVERDCVALWWYNRAQRPGVALDSFDEPLFEELVEGYHRLGRELHVLDIATDLEIPAFAAISWRRSDRSGLLLGFGAHVEAGLAIARALTELHQFLPATAEGTAPTLVSEPVTDVAFLEPDRSVAYRQSGDYPRSQAGDLRHHIRRCRRRAESLGLEILVLDQTRPEVGLAVVKVVVPGLRHFWARLGPGRLFTVPVSLGWLEAPRPEEDLLPAHLLI